MRPQLWFGLYVLSTLFVATRAFELHVPSELVWGEELEVSWSDVDPSINEIIFDISCDNHVVYRTSTFDSGLPSMQLEFALERYRPPHQCTIEALALFPFWWTPLGSSTFKVTHNSSALTTVIDVPTTLAPTGVGPLSSGGNVNDNQSSSHEKNTITVYPGTRPTHAAKTVTIVSVVPTPPEPVPPPISFVPNETQKTSASQTGSLPITSGPVPGAAKRPSEKQLVGAIIGGIVAGIAFIAVIVVIYCIRRRQNRRQIAPGNIKVQEKSSTTLPPIKANGRHRLTWLKEKTAHPWGQGHKIQNVPSENNQNGEGYLEVKKPEIGYQAGILFPGVLETTDKSWRQSLRKTFLNRTSVNSIRPDLDTGKHTSLHLNPGTPEFPAAAKIGTSPELVPWGLNTDDMEERREELLEEMRKRLHGRR